MPSEEGPGYEKEEEVDTEKRRESEEEVLDRGDSQVCPIQVLKIRFAQKF